MKLELARVTLDFALKVPGSIMDGEQYEISSDDASRVEGKPGAMHYDSDLNSLVFGDSDYGVNWSHVVKWERANLELVCDLCEKTFTTGQALGGHRRACKQKDK